MNYKSHYITWNTMVTVKRFEILAPASVPRVFIIAYFCHLFALFPLYIDQGCAAEIENCIDQWNWTTNSLRPSDAYMRP